MGANRRTVDEQLGRRAPGRGQGMENIHPYALVGPPHEAAFKRRRAGVARVRQAQCVEGFSRSGARACSKPSP